MPIKAQDRKLTAPPDTVDFRDQMFEPTLVEVPVEITPATYRRVKVPILDQGEEGACTGFGLATVIHYLMRRRHVRPDHTPVSPEMLYQMARRYDEWEGENYSGSSARGAMKAWYNHGVCAEALWPSKGSGPSGTAPANVLSHAIATDAATRPLGAYLRVNHQNLVAMHCAIAEVGGLFATSTVHDGWNHPSKTGRIPLSEGSIGGHAFAIVGYNRDGFWLQNSWGVGWGDRGFGLVTYEDWLANATDVWVARLGVPMDTTVGTLATSRNASVVAGLATQSFVDLRPHVVSVGNGGLPRESGTFGTSQADITEILTADFQRITADWKTKRLLLYAHGGLVSETAALQRVAESRQPLIDAEVYPLAFVWKTDYWTTITNIIKDAVSRRSEGILDGAKDFMLDRLDDAVEPMARVLTGKAEWDEMKENAIASTTSVDGAARLVAALIAKLPADVELHVAGHSAGAIFLARLVQLLTSSGTVAAGQPADAAGLGRTLASCTLWAPACTMDLFADTYLDALRNEHIKRFGLFTLTDQAEQDDNCAGIYHKSLLYLVSNAFETHRREPGGKDGEPILGMEKFVTRNRPLQQILKLPQHVWVRAPNQAPEGSAVASRASRHGDFDDDQATIKATFARILGRTQLASTVTQLSFGPSASGRRDRRAAVQRAIQPRLA